MWLYFNENGQLLETLEHGSQPRAGSTDFRIFAYFEGWDEPNYDFENSPLVTMTLIKPDFDRTPWPEYKATPKSLPYRRMENENPFRFSEQKIYNGYELDFSSLDGGVLLSMPGLYKLIVSVYNRKGSSVLGVSTFSVGNGSMSDAERGMPDMALLKDIYAELAQRVPYRSGAYIKVVTSVSGTDFGDRAMFGYGDKIFVSDENALYRLDPDGLTLLPFGKEMGFKIRELTDTEVDSIEI